MIEYRAVLNAVRDAIFLADIETGMVVDANPAAEALCGRSLADLRLLHYTQLYPPERSESSRHSFERHAQDPNVTEGIILHKDGHQIPVEVSSSHFTAPNGRPMLIGLFRDITERTAAREALRRSEERFRQVAESAGDFIWEVDANGLYLYASPAVERILGYTPEEIVGTMHFYDLFVPEKRREMIAAAFEVFSRREPFRDFLNWNVRKDGGIVALETSGVPILGGNGELLGYRGVDTDVTKRKRAEEILTASEEKYRALVETTDTGYLILDKECKVIDANREYVRLTGHSDLGEILGRSVVEWTAAHEKQKNAEALARCVKDGFIGNLVMDYVDENNHITPVEINAKVIGGSESIRIICLCRDITERKQAEEALRESEKQLISIYNTVRDVIFRLAVEPEGQFRFVSVNAAFLRATGLSREAVVGKTVNEVIPEPSLMMVLEKYRQAVEQKAIVSWEETSDYPTGPLTGEVSVAPVFDNKGTCTHLVGSVHDITERKHAESALRESEERFRTVADTAPVMIWMSGLDKFCTFFNKPWLEFRGRTMEQEAGNGWADGVHHEDLDHCLATYTSSFDARRNFQMEYRLRRADGEYRWVLDNGTPLYREGEFAGYIGSCIDVTEQKQIEQQLRSKQAQLMDSQRLAKVGSWELDVATGRVRWSDEMYRIYGLPNDTRPDFQMFLNLVHPKDRGIIPEAEKKALSSNAPFAVEFRITRPDGEVRFIRSILEAVKNDKGALVCLAGAAQDITEQVKATELLRESEARLKTAERMTHVGNWTWDIKANRVSWSEEILRIMGRPQDHEPSYEGSLQLMAPGERERVEQWVRDCLAEKRGNLIEFRIIRPGGDVRTVVCTSEVLLDDDGSPEHMFGACQDVTDARRAQEESFARQKLESLGTLASGIAHDFNNLLGAVLAQTELAMANLATGSHPDEELKAIRDVAIRGSEIVRQLMIYAGKEGDVLEPVDASKAVEGMLGLLKITVSRHATLVTDLGENLPAVKARAAQIRQIVMNLVVNASDAIKDRGGMIRVSTGCVTVVGDTASTAPEGLAEGKYVQLEISDTGSGMSPETLARIFDPFFTTKSAGQGLGLAVVHGIVRSLNGAIRVVSELNNGTTFQILLPCAGDAARAAADQVAGIDQVARPSREATVLVVEDEHPLRLAVTKMLGKAGFGVLEVSNGCDAIDLLRAKAGEIDVILLDMTIPGAPSHEVLAEAARARPNMKVILTSAYSEQMAKAVLNAPQVCGFVRKPFQFADLVRTVRSALSSQVTP